MSSRYLSRALPITAAFWAIFVACSLGDVDFGNKACPCGTGYVCDSQTNVCVLPSAVSVAADGGTQIATGEASAGDCIGDTCACVVDGDCKDRERSHCSSSTKTCVECVVSDHCRAGTYCNDANQCVLGCKQESDCQISPAAPHCDTARHQCVACRTIADCALADQCSPSGECVQGCDLDAGKLCPSGKQCCQNLCIDTTKDLFNCGGCGIACSAQNSTPSCVSSACTWSCAGGYAHCEATNSGCETNVRTNPLHCNACGRDCNALVANAAGVGCSAGLCTYQTCNANNDDCDGNRETGCECACGTKKNERCCPGSVCNPGLTCNLGANKCQ